MIYTSERMSIVFSRPPVDCSPNQKTFLNKYVGPSFKRLRMKPSWENNAKAIAAS